MLGLGFPESSSYLVGVPSVCVLNAIVLPVGNTEEYFLRGTVHTITFHA